MKRIEIVLADSDEIYLEHVAHYFMGKAQQCEVIATFSSKESLLCYLSSHGLVDVLLVDQELICQELDTCSVSVKMMLTTADKKQKGYESVRKYQKTEDLLNEILLKYAKLTGDLDAVRGKRRTKVVAFYWRTVWCSSGSWNFYLWRQSVFYQHKRELYIS